MTEINELITVPEIEEAIEVDAPAEAEVSEEPPPKRPRGRPKGKAKPKTEPRETPAKRVVQPVYDARPPPLDMNVLTHMLAEHLKTEKQTARAKRHDAWGGFF
jgi:hypothetical protein